MVCFLGRGREGRCLRRFDNISLAFLSSFLQTIMMRFTHKVWDDALADATPRTSEYLSIMNAIEVKHPHILNCLMDQRQV